MKKRLSLLLLLLLLASLGCASGAPRKADANAAVSAAAKANAGAEDVEDEEEEDDLVIWDPIAPWNRAMYHVNDKLYFWILKPTTKGYNFVVPEPARIGVRNFFDNVTMPIRAINCLLQGKFKGFGTEIGRFCVNSTWGVLGFGDPATKKLKWRKYDEDFGQTLGFYGLGHGLYIVWPVFGASSLRNTAGIVGDTAADPKTYLRPWGVRVGVNAYDRVNRTSLRIGDYEALKEAAIDPYVSIRNAFLQHRKKKVEE
jgi:phospholipid-binding lipoprotein MlaA